MNTLVRYKFRDSGNYKNFGEVILKGTLTEEQAEQFEKKIGLECDFEPRAYEKYGFSPLGECCQQCGYEDGGHELDAFDPTDRNPSDSKAHTVQEFLEDLLLRGSCPALLPDGRDSTLPQKYTVVLLYPDYCTEDYGADIYVDTAEGKDGFEAARAVQKMAAEANNQIHDPSDFRVIAVIKGDVQLELDATDFEEASS